MAVPETLFVERARRAYEWGRLWAALPTAALVLPMVALSLVVCQRYAATACCGSALALLATFFVWRGQEYAGGVRMGFLAGLAPLLLPVVAQGHLCGAGVCLLMPSLCIGGGVLGGLGVAALTIRGGAGRRVLLSALVVTGLAGSLGCVMAGLSGVIGMTVGMALGASPLLFLPQASIR